MERNYKELLKDGKALIGAVPGSCSYQQKKGKMAA